MGQGGESEGVSRSLDPGCLPLLESDSETPALVSPYAVVIIASRFVNIFLYKCINCHYSDYIKALDFSRGSWVTEVQGFNLFKIRL